MPAGTLRNVNPKRPLDGFTARRTAHSQTDRPSRCFFLFTKGQTPEGLPVGFVQTSARESHADLPGHPCAGAACTVRIRRIGKAFGLARAGDHANPAGENLPYRLRLLLCRTAWRTLPPCRPQSSQSEGLTKRVNSTDLVFACASFSSAFPCEWHCPERVKITFIRGFSKAAHGHGVYCGSPRSCAWHLGGKHAGNCGRNPDWEKWPNRLSHSLSFKATTPQSLPSWKAPLRGIMFLMNYHRMTKLAPSSGLPKMDPLLNVYTN